MSNCEAVNCSPNDDLTLALYFRKQVDDCDLALDVADADVHIAICTQPSRTPILTMGAGEDRSGCVLTIDPDEAGKAALYIPAHFWLLHEPGEFSVHAVAAFGDWVSPLGSQTLNVSGHSA